jgi:phosphatidylglycerophosphatase A
MRTSHSAVTVAARSTWANGRVERTRSAHQFSTRMCWKTWNLDKEAAANAIMTERKTFWAWTTATFFGAGLGKPGPGTWGSLAAVLIWFALGRLSGLSVASLSWVTVGGVFLAILAGVPAATVVARESGREDPGHVVIDEVAGQWIALIGSVAMWKSALLAFILFRIFDIVKPWPVRQLEKLPRGWGIVFDDVAAGLYAWVVVAIAHKWMLK